MKEERRKDQFDRCLRHSGLMLTPHTLMPHFIQTLDCALNSLPAATPWQPVDHPASSREVRNSESNRTFYIFIAVQLKAVGHRCCCNCDMLGTFSGLQAHRALAYSFHLGASVVKNHCVEAVMGTRWQHVSVLQELSTIHILVPVTPFLCFSSPFQELALRWWWASLFTPEWGVSWLLVHGGVEYHVCY